MLTRSLPSVVLAATLCIALSSSATASIVTELRLDQVGGFTAASYTFTEVGLVDNGVTFDATITTTGSADLTQTTSGLGVDGNGSTLLNDGEFLSFTVSVANVVGGTVAFDGFTAVDPTFFGGTDAGVFNDTADLVTPLAFINADPTVFGMPLGGGIGVTSFLVAGPAASSFRVDDISAQFTGTAAAGVPEPGTTAALAVLAIGMTATAIRRRRNRTAQKS
ncbi:MAG: PEP-CTERM sorting domain-containing protein [Planctomycetota bacterium]